MNRQGWTLRGANGFNAFLLIGVFTVMALLVVVLGAGVYQRIVARADENYALRTALTYVTGKVRASMGSDVDVEITRLWDGIYGLSLTEGDYATRIYAHDGTLYEIFSALDAEFAPEDGQKIGDVDDFSVAWATENLLDISVRIDGIEYSACVADIRK